MERFKCVYYANTARIMGYVLISQTLLHRVQTNVIRRWSGRSGLGKGVLLRWLVDEFVGA